MKAKVGISKIHGIGLFAKDLLLNGDYVGRVNYHYAGDVTRLRELPTTGYITSEGDVMAAVGGFPIWYLNYSDTPNVKLEGNLVLTIKSIAGGDELTLADPNKEVQGS